MTDDFEGRLRGALTGATEGLPDNPSRYEQTEARVRRGRRRAGAVAVAAAVVLVAAGIAAPQVFGRLTNNSADSALQKGPIDLTNLSCPDPAVPGPAKQTGSGPLVPEGAVSARFCPAQPDVEGAPVGDLDLMKVTITQNVDQLVRALNQLDPVSRNPTCTDELGPTYDLALGYPDGRVAVIAFEAYGCGVAKYGDEYRLGASRLPELGERLLRDQPDAALKCPAGDEPMDLPTRSPAGTFVPEGANVARLCARDNGTALSGVIFDQTNAAALAEELNTLKPVDPNAACTMELGITYDLVLGYPDGRKIVTTFEAFGCGYAQSGTAFRMGANRVPEVAAGLAEQQRLQGNPPWTPAFVPECPLRLEPGEKGRQNQLYDSYLRDPDNAVPQRADAGRLCRYEASDSSTALTEQQELSPVQAESLRRLVNQSARQRTVTCDWTSYTGPVDIILFADRAGGSYELRVLHGDCTALLDVNGVAQASPALLQRIDALFR